MIALRRSGIGTQKVKVCTIGQNNWVPPQLYANRVFYELNDILTKYMRLSLTGRQEDLIAPRFQSINKRLVSKVKCRPYLARLKNVPDAVF